MDPEAFTFDRCIPLKVPMELNSVVAANSAPLKALFIVLSSISRITVLSSFGPPMTSSFDRLIFPG